MLAILVVRSQQASVLGIRFGSRGCVSLKRHSPAGTNRVLLADNGNVGSPVALLASLQYEANGVALLG